MTNLQKKAIEHALERLNEISTYEVYSHVLGEAEKLNVDPEVKKKLLKELENAQNIHIRDNLDESTSWLNTLLKDLTDV